MTTYDAVIVGARAAGAATALGLARRGHRVLVLDRDRYGADTLSTHALQRTAVLLLERWGLLEELRHRGTPRVDAVSFHYQGMGVTHLALDEPMYAPRRTVLDPMLADAAQEAGADVRWRCSVQDVLRGADGRVRGVVVREADGTVRQVEAAVTIGADGRGSRIARAVDAPTTHRGRNAGAYVYAHIDGVIDRGFRWLFGHGLAAGVIPTDGGLSTVFVGGAADLFDGLRRDPAGELDRILRVLDPAVADEVADGSIVGPVRGFPGERARLRRPHGPGWALVGDAGSFKDPISAHGITDALKDAELLVGALDDVFTGRRDESSALREYERVRDELTRPLLEVIDPLAAHDLPVEALAAGHLRFSQVMQAEAAAFRARFAREDADARPLAGV